MKIKFLGVGSAFTTAKYYQSNLLITADNGKKLLIDCGGDIRFSLAEQGLGYGDIDAIYISHLHGDHVGGMEYMAINRYFDKRYPNKPKLFMIRNIMEELWEHSLKGGLETIEGKIATLTDFFDCIPIDLNTYFDWEGIRFFPVQMVHTMSGYKIQHSFGLLFGIIDDQCALVGSPELAVVPEKIFLTTDTQLCSNQVWAIYRQAKVILHDCETSNMRSGVHPHYDDLKTLAPEYRSKMWLYHYQPGGEERDAQADGFKGFATKGMELEFPPK